MRQIRSRSGDNLQLVVWIACLLCLATTPGDAFSLGRPSLPNRPLLSSRIASKIQPTRPWIVLSATNDEDEASTEELVEKKTTATPQNETSFRLPNLRTWWQNSTVATIVAESNSTATAVTQLTTLAKQAWLTTWKRVQVGVYAFTAGLVVAAAAILVPLFAIGSGATGSTNPLIQPVTLFETILADLESTYVDPIDTQKLFETGMNAMLSSLDPYTEFEGKEDAVAVMESIDGKYGGVGLVISGATKPTTPAVTEPVLPKNEETPSKEVVNPDSSSDEGESAASPVSSTSTTTTPNVVNANEKTNKNSIADINDDDDDDDDAIDRRREERLYQNAASKGIRVVTAFEGYAFDYGMRPGDKLVAVDDTPIVPGVTVEDVRNALRGTPGSWVTIQFERDGVSGVQTVTMPRAIVRIRDVKLATLLPQQEDASSVGYIRLAAFSSDTGREVRQAILALQRAAQDQSGGERTLDGLVLDLRSNPGGLLTSAVDVCSLLVPKGSDIVSARGRGFPGILYRSRVDPILEPQTKLAVLVNGQTASAAEIVSGAIQDLDVGVVVGSGRTYGKGLVQNVESLPYDTALKFTVAKYYTPSGRCIQGVNYQAGGGRNDEKGYTAQKVAEKDRSTFFTRNGRMVKDGGGIEADVRVDPPKASALEVTLIRSGIMNDFAAQWSQQHDLQDYFRPNLPSNKRFEVVDNDTYQQFIAFCQRKEQSGELELEAIYSKNLRDLQKTLQRAGYKGAEKSVGQLQQRIVRDMQSDFQRYRKDIMEDLGQAILSRYLPESMLVERQLGTDQQVQTAAQVLRQPSRYQQLLAGDAATEPPDGGPSTVNMAAETTVIRKRVADF